MLSQLPQSARDCYLRLLHGDLRTGFQQLERRPRSLLPGALWTGQSIAGKTILLRGAEGGFGDDLMFARYVPLIGERGGRVILLVPRQLQRLLATLPGIVRTIPTDLADGSPEQARAPGVSVQYDCWNTFTSLPHAFDTTLETIPDRPYLSGDPEPWRGFLVSMPGLKVGLVWAGEHRSGHHLDRNADKRRSMRLSDMAPLLRVPGCSFVSLQMGPPAKQLASTPPGLIRDVSARLSDWADTAGLVSGLDLVVTVDTAVAHLAGALGKPVWLLNARAACWRWLLDRSDSPWYPSMRIYRQPAPGDWASVIRDVTRDLSAKVARR